MPDSSSKLQHHFFLVIFIAALVAMWFIWRPFLAPLVLAGSLAIVFHPLYERLKRGLGEKPTLAAFLTVIVILLAVLVPLVLVGGLLLNEAKNLYVDVANNNGTIAQINTFMLHVQHNVHKIAPDVNLDLGHYLQNTLQLGLHLWAFPIRLFGELQL
jgi:predicted PurR-regulated permease PerM